MIRLYTVGHSTRTVDDLAGLLRAADVRLLVDVRTIPRSRTNPQFNKDSLPAALAPHGIVYRHMPELGGLRKPRADSANTAWRNASFRGYADYMQTPEFEAALGTLIDAARDTPTAVMCAEAVPWRCHRSLISDALAARGVPVVHLTGSARTPRLSPHELTEWARVEGTKVTYPGLHAGV
jgi:uncharacterized protein (DUF488 family)